MNNKKHTLETKEKIRQSKIGKKRTFTSEWIENLRKASIRVGNKPPSAKGRKWTAEQYITSSIAMRGPRPQIAGSKNPNWKGGLGSERQKFMRSPEYKAWRKHVYYRDNYTCQSCGKRGGQLEADHELPFSLYPDLRLEILNGRTLCKPCHYAIKPLLKVWILLSTD